MSKKLTQYYKKSIRKRPYINIWAIVVSVIVITSFLMIALGVSAHKIKEYSEKNFYFVYSGKYTQINFANEQCTKVTDMGGAGVLYYVGNTKFVIINAYFNESDANSVKSKVVEMFSDAGVIKVTANKLSKKSAQHILSVSACKLYYRKFHDFCNSLYSMIIDYDLEKNMTSAVYKNVMLYKQQFQEISAQLQLNADDVSKNMYSSALLVIEQINNFFSSSFVSNNIGKYLKKMYVNAIIEFVDLCENIK